MKKLPPDSLSGKNPSLSSYCIAIPIFKILTSFDSPFKDIQA